MADLLPFFNKLKSHVENGAIHGGSSVIATNNTCWVNTTLETSNPTLRLFKNYADALSWIIANGSPSEENPWQIILPAGNVGNIIISNAFIRIVGNQNTYIQNLSSTLEFSLMNIITSLIMNVNIANITSHRNTLIALDNCKVFNIAFETVIPDNVPGYLFAVNSTFLSGDFNHITPALPFKNCTFFSQEISIPHLNGSFEYCDFTNVIFNAGQIIDEIGNTVDLKLYSCKFGINCAIGNNSGVAKTVQLNACNFDNYISILTDINLQLYACNFDRLYFNNNGCTIRLINSFVKQIINSEGVTTAVSSSGFSKYCVKVGEITFRDLNAGGDGSSAQINFSDAIPNNQFIDDIFFVFNEKFERFYAYPAVEFTLIQQARGDDNIANEEGTIINNTFNGLPSNTKDLLVSVELSDSNPKDWTAGRISVYAFLKSIPTDLF